ncbi:MAG TPA: putative Fe-S cluster assembly protein SufT [Ilumatobacteraceae bacterium]|jgi:probable FeS assembly SUF system protein SufT|nr:putative Fe-S cluster assembly protein SufT [Ilumatobacteraceae bacterium]
MTSWTPIELSRACAATTVPYGEQVTLDAGGLVEIVQRLGASITVRTQMGSLLRIDGTDADALGLDPIGVGHRAADGPFEIDQVVDALQQIFDPEIPVSIVELGLVYRCDEIIEADGSRRIEIDMTMTAPGCGMGDVLRADALRAVQAIPAVDEVDVQIVFDPPWNIGRMSEAARLQLGLM